MENMREQGDEEEVFALVLTFHGLMYDYKSPRRRHSRLIHLLDSVACALHSLGNYNAIVPPRADKRQIRSYCEALCREGLFYTL